MGRSVARRKNFKARKGSNQTTKLSTKNVTSTDEDKKNVVKIEFDVDNRKYDDANPLVLPSNKAVNDGKVKESEVPSKKKPKKVLSLKKQKKLRKVLERKQKIQDRSKILEELQKHQLDAQTYSALASTSNLHTKGLKRGIEEVYDLQAVTSEPGKIRTVSKRKRKSINSLDPKKTKLGGNVLGFEKSDDETESEEEEEEAGEDEKPLIGSEEDKVQTPGVIETENSAKEKENPTNEHPQNHTSENSANNQGENCDNKQSDETKNETDNQSSEDLTKKSDEKDKVETKESSKSKKETNYVDMTTKFVPVNRDPAIEASRSKLPIISEEQFIMEKIRYNDVTILCGETGSGKTTQIPQFLYEAGYAINKRIGITEPRRVAAIAMSHRVGHEMNLSNEIVSYQIRFEGNCSDKTAIKFMTDGILLKEIQKDLLLSSYSVIIIDEAHERTVYSDILIGLLSRIIKLRSRKQDPLKLIIMSATLRVDDFIKNPNLFKSKPPVIEIKSRQYPVTTHFNKITPGDYLSEAYNKVCKIHRNMPKNGGILVFLTGQQEVITLCQKLRRTFPFNENSIAQQKEKEDELEVKKLSRKEAKKLRRGKPKTLADISPAIDLDAYGQDIDLADDVSDNDDDIVPNDGGELNDDLVVSCSDPLYVLPLFSHLNEKRQRKIFENPPEGVRLCVVSTNIAETSLTIPNIKYVVDTGKVKMKFYDQVTGVSTFLIDWTSKASADQRAGRSGRMGPGHCYRLYSSAIFQDNFKDFSDPEIVRKPIDDLVLQMKSMNIDNVKNFPFPTPPKAENVTAAEKRLVLLGALKTSKIISTKFNVKRTRSRKQFKYINRITPLGKVLSYFPLSPRYAKMLILTSQHNLISYGVSIVSALTVQELFVSSTIMGSEDDGKRLYKDKLATIRKRWAGSGNSLLLGDMMIFLCAIGAWEHVDCAPEFCSKYGLRFKAMNEIRKLRQQLQKEIVTIFPQLEFPMDMKMTPPSDAQAKCLRQVLLSGLFDHVARLMPEDEKKDEDKRKLKKAYQSTELDLPVFISTDSVVYDLSPEWIIYQEIYETQKLFMRHVVAIEPEWLPIYAPAMCKFSKPLIEPMPRYDAITDRLKCTVTCTFGPLNWPIPDAEIDYPETDEEYDKYHWFVRFLLEGDVIKYFASKRSLLLSPPSIMQKSWYKLQKRTQGILINLRSDKILTRQGLIKKWKEDPKYLLIEYLQWIPEAYHLEITSEWPPLDKSDSIEIKSTEST